MVSFPGFPDEADFNVFERVEHVGGVRILHRVHVLGGSLHLDGVWVGDAFQERTAQHVHAAHMAFERPEGEMPFREETVARRQMRVEALERVTLDSELPLHRAQAELEPGEEALAQHRQ